MKRNFSATTKNNNKLERKLKRDHGGKCETRGCNRTRNLEWAHKYPTGLSGAGRGRSNRLYDVESHPKSYRLSCREHNPRTGPKKGRNKK